ncbi:MAG: fibronectin type III domain-containing protein, partial [Prevotellaceae bacterium]|nr:fibronectin type III domain-containing protein [Prevotellaceae bacterium]
VEAPDTTLTVTGLEAETNYFVVVTALSGDLRSEPSEEIMVRTKVSETNDIKGTDTNNVSWRVNGRMITISNANGKRITICDTAGRVISDTKATKGRHTIMLPSHGVYILRIGGKGIKIGI